MAAETKVRCSFGSEPGLVHKTPGAGGFDFNGSKVMTQSECIAGVHIDCFGQCNANPKQPKPCSPNGVWLYPCEMFQEGDASVITTDSCIICARGGGIITVDKNNI